MRGALAARRFEPGDGTIVVRPDQRKLVLGNRAGRTAALWVGGRDPFFEDSANRRDGETAGSGLREGGGPDT